MSPMLTLRMVFCLVSCLCPLHMALQKYRVHTAHRRTFTGQLLVDLGRLEHLSEEDEGTLSAEPGKEAQS